MIVLGHDLLGTELSDRDESCGPIVSGWTRYRQAAAEEM